MPENCRLSVFAVAALLAGGGMCGAQPGGARDGWLMQNYRFTGPPPAGAAAPEDPMLSELRQIQNTLLSIMRKADFGEDYEAALAFAAQATATAQLIGSITAARQSAEAAKPARQTAATLGNPVYSIAFKDHSVEPATEYWTDELMLHYITPGGAHVQVRLDLVDRNLSMKLNRAKNLDFRFPE